MDKRAYAKTRMANVIRRAQAQAPLATSDINDAVDAIIDAAVEVVSKRKDGWEALPLLMTQDEVSDLLRVSERTVWRYVDEGRLPTVEIGPALKRFRREDVLAFIDGQQ